MSPSPGASPGPRPVSPAVAALTAASAGAAYVLAVRPRLLRWGATTQEAAGPLPGDEIIPAPRMQSTRAITISAPVAEVWPWLVQMGAGRGGFSPTTGSNAARVWASGVRTGFSRSCST